MDNQMILLMQDFQRKLNQDPDNKELQKTPDGNANSLPISFVEMTLDELFFGQWELSECQTQQVFNEVTGTGVLTVWHPVTGRPIKRTGFASVVITQDKDAKLADFNFTKKKNALDLTFPKLKAEILKNAASSLGKVFGRDINRKVADTFKPSMKPISKSAFDALVKRLEEGDDNALTLAQANFLMTDDQVEILKNCKQKQLA